MLCRAGPPVSRNTHGAGLLCKSRRDAPPSISLPPGHQTPRSQKSESCERPSQSIQKISAIAMWRQRPLRAVVGSECMPSYVRSVGPPKTASNSETDRTKITAGFTKKMNHLCRRRKTTAVVSPRTRSVQVVGSGIMVNSSWEPLKAKVPVFPAPRFV